MKKNKQMKYHIQQRKSFHVLLYSQESKKLKLALLIRADFEVIVKIRANTLSVR